MEQIYIYHSPYGDIKVSGELGEIVKSRYELDVTSDECIELEAALDLIIKISFQAGLNGEIKPLFP
jgi:hypothetical protein